MGQVAVWSQAIGGEGFRMGDNDGGEKWGQVQHVTTCWLGGIASWEVAGKCAVAESLADSWGNHSAFCLPFARSTLSADSTLDPSRYLTAFVLTL